MNGDRIRIVCLMTSSVDGRLHPSRYTNSPDGTHEQWSAAFEAVHEELATDAWIVGRVTMGELSNGVPHPPAEPGTPPRPVHVAARRGPYAVALDRSGRLHFSAPDVGGDHVVVLLGPDVPDAHLAELVADGISYVVAADPTMALAPLVDTLRREFGIETLAVEGGARIYGSFFAAGLVDELHVLLAPALDGSPSPSVVESGEDGLKGRVALSLSSCDRLDGGIVRLLYAVSTDTTEPRA